MMLKKMIVLCLLIAGCAMLHAADDEPQVAGTFPVTSYFGAAQRFMWDRGSPRPFQMYRELEFNPSADRRLFFITDTTSDQDKKTAELHRQFGKLSKDHTATDVDGILRVATDAVDNALFVLVAGKRVVISRKGQASKALLIMREGPALPLACEVQEPVIAHVLQMSAYKGIVFTRGMSLTDEQINDMVKATLAQKGATPGDVAIELINADHGEAVAAGFLDYDIFDQKVVVSDTSSPLRDRLYGYKEKKKKKKCVLQ